MLVIKWGLRSEAILALPACFLALAQGVSWGPGSSLGSFLQGSRAALQGHPWSRPKPAAAVNLCTSLSLCSKSNAACLGHGLRDPPAPPRCGRPEAPGPVGLEAWPPPRGQLGRGSGTWPYRSHRLRSASSYPGPGLWRVKLVPWDLALSCQKITFA